jgi:hypothetical protein
MPFIRGRYHINPIAGEALEAARAAEADSVARALDSRLGGWDEREHGDTERKGPIHHVEIEPAELVPAHSGRAARGFVVRIQRHPPQDGDGAADLNDQAQDKAAPAQTETHAFTDHRDLVSFLRGEFAKDCPR